MRVCLVRPRDQAVAVCAVFAVLGSCGSGADETADVEEFCRQVRELNENDVDVAEDLDVALAQFEGLVADAPADLRDDLEVVVDAFSELSEVDENDPDAFVAFFEVLGRPEVVAAAENLERFGVEECGLEPDEESAAVETGSSAAALDAEPSVGDPDVAGDDRYDEEFWGVIDPDELSIPGIEQHLDVNHPDSGWFDTLTGYGLGGTSSISASGGIPDGEAVAICAAILEYAAPLEPDVSITIEDESDGIVATGTVADGCTGSSLDRLDISVAARP